MKNEKLQINNLIQNMNVYYKCIKQTNKNTGWYIKKKEKKCNF